MAKRGNGEGSIYFSGKLNRWVGQYTYLGKRKSVYGKTRKEVAQKINTAINDIKERTFVDKSDVTIGELILNYINYKKDANLVSDSTYLRDKQTYITMTKISKNFIESKVQKISNSDIKNFLNLSNSYSNTTINKIYRLLNCAFKKAQNINLIQKNPLDNKLEILKPKSLIEDKKVEALTIDEQRYLLDKLDYNHPYTNIILLMLFTGMRVGEVLALDVNSINNNLITIRRTLTKNEKSKVVIGKTTKTYTSQRTISVLPFVKNILDNSIKNMVPNKSNLLFSKNNDELTTPQEVNSYLHRLNEKYNISNSLHNHMLRHTYATRCIESGMTAVVLAKKLGHKDVSVTLNTYTSVFAKYENTQDDRLLNYLGKENLQLH